MHIANLNDQVRELTPREVNRLISEQMRQERRSERSKRAGAGVGKGGLQLWQSGAIACVLPAKEQYCAATLCANR